MTSDEIHHASGHDPRGPDRYLRRICGPKFVAPRAAVESFIRAQEASVRYLAEEFDIRFDDVDLSRSPEHVCREFSDETIAAIAAILNEQSLKVAELAAKVRELSAAVKKGKARGLGSLIKGLWRSKDR